MSVRLALIAAFALSFFSGACTSRAECEAQYNEPCWPRCCIPEFASEEERAAYIEAWQNSPPDNRISVDEWRATRDPDV